MSKHDALRPGARRYRGLAADDRIRERRQRFLSAGLECFGRNGYHGVTVRELCAQAQLTERYFYESFKDREALFAAVYENLVEQLRADFVAVAERSGNSLDALSRAGLRLFYQRLQQDRRVARMLLVEVLTVSSAMERRALDATFGFGDLLIDLAGTRFNKPGVNAQQARLIAAGLVGAAVQIAMRWTTERNPQSVDAAVDAAMIFFGAGIRHSQPTLAAK